MPTEVEAPNGQVIEFPDSMSRDEIRNVMREKFGGRQAQTNPDPLRRQNVPIQDMTFPAMRVGSGLGLGGHRDPGPQRRGPTPGEIAEATGVSTEGASSGARFDLNLALSAAENEEEELDIAQTALERRLGEGVEVRIGPDTGELEFKAPGADQFTLFNAPGLDFGDIAAAGPETGVLATGVAGGLGGMGFGGATTGTPFGAAAGAVLGEGAGEALGELVRLRTARERDLVDLSDNEILRRAAVRGGIASSTGAVGAATIRLLARLANRQFGMDFDVLDAAGGEEGVRRGVEETAETQQRVRDLTGREFPVTTGQATQEQELLRAEDRARTFRREGEPIRDIDRQQREALGEAERQTFGGRAGPGDVRRSGTDLRRATEERERRATRPTQRRVQDFTERARQAEEEAMATLRTPETATESLRERVEEGRDRVFQPFRERFNEIQNEQGIEIDLTPFRQEIQRMRQQEGQDILPSISLQQQSTLLREGERAGQRDVQRLEFGEDNLLQLIQRTEDDPPSLGETQRAIQDIRRELRRPGLADEPQRQRLLTRLKNSLVEARSASLDEATQEQVLDLEQQFAQAAERFDRGVIGTVTDVDQFGNPTISGAQAINRIIQTPESAREFVTAAQEIPAGDKIIMDAQDGVLGLVRDRFRDEDGNLRANALQQFLNRNRRALEEVFQGREDKLRALDNANRFAREAESNQRLLDRARDRIQNAFGFASADPAVIVPRLLQENRVEDLQRARRILPESRRPLFDKALAREARDQMVATQDRQPVLSSQRIDEFLDSGRGETVANVLGDEFRQNLRTVRDALRTVERQSTARAPRDVGSAFSRGVPGLQGLFRFTRVFAPPLSPRGRALTATLGVTSESARRRIAQALADPEKLAQLARLERVSADSQAANAILSRLGFAGIAEARRQSENQPETPPGAQRRRTVDPSGLGQVPENRLTPLAR